MAKQYVGIVDFMSNTIDTLNKDDMDLPIYDADVSKLAKSIGNNGYTFLQINDGTNIELVKAEYVAGDIVLYRGLEETVPTTFPSGSEVRWIMTPGAVRDIICQMDCCPGVNENEPMAMDLG